jgi:hypothetical protein
MARETCRVCSRFLENGKCPNEGKQWHTEWEDAMESECCKEPAVAYEVLAILSFVVGGSTFATLVAWWLLR